MIASQLCWPICKAMSVRALQADERWLAGKRLLLSRLKFFSQQKQYRGSISADKVNASYSGLVVLATPCSAVFVAQGERYGT